MAEKQFINPKGLVKPGVYTPVITVRGGKTLRGELQNRDAAAAGQGAQ